MQFVYIWRARKAFEDTLLVAGLGTFKPSLVDALFFICE